MQPQRIQTAATASPRTRRGWRALLVKARSSTFILAAAWLLSCPFVADQRARAAQQNPPASPPAEMSKWDAHTSSVGQHKTTNASEAGTSTTDCNSNGLPDDQEIASGTSTDCNLNGIPDGCDAAGGSAPCRVHNVDRNWYFTTIQQAIDDSYGYEEIVVAPGTYGEFINFHGKNITLRCTNPDDPGIVAATILTLDFNVNPAAWAPIVMFNSGESRNAVLAGFTITGGQQNAPGAAGSGVFCQNASPLIRQNVITGNSAFFGGGVHFDNSSALFERNYVRGNTAIHSGGGIKIVNSSAVELRNNVITGNKALNNDGGGIDLFNCPSGTAPTIRNNFLAGNYSKWGGAGISASNAAATIRNNIVYENRGGTGLFANAQSTLDICYNDVWSNPTANHGGTAQPCASGELSVDPMLVDSGQWTDPNGTPLVPADDLWADGDYHLQQSSQCIDAGDPSGTPGSNELDFQGNPRLRCGRVDIGPDETESVCLSIHNITQGTFHATIQGAIDIASPGDTIELSPGLYHETIAIPIAITIRSLDTSSAQVVASTVIEGCGDEDEFGIPVVTVIADQVLISGLTITGCPNTGTIGIHIDGSHATVNSCLIRSSHQFNVDFQGMNVVNGSHVVIENTSFKSCFAAEGAAGLNCLNSRVELSATRFEDNYGYRVGAVMAQQCEFLAYDFDIIDNRANEDGPTGGVYLVNTTIDISEGRINRNTGTVGGLYCVSSQGGVFQTTLEDNEGHGDAASGAMYMVDSDIQIVGCTFSRNSVDGGSGGIYALRSNAMIESCIIQQNHIWARPNGAGGLYVDGNLLLRNTIIQGNIAQPCQADPSYLNTSCANDLLFAQSGDVWIDNTIADVAGTIEGSLDLTKNGVMVVRQGYGLSFVKNGEVRNGGTIQVELGGTLLLRDDAIMDLGFTGLVDASGIISVQDNAVIRNTRLQINRAVFDDTSGIFNNVIRAQAGSPFGEFFIANTATVAGNEIHADGDRYLDLDPQTFAGLIQNNCIFVEIREGVGSTRGGLFELRGLDLSCDPATEDCLPGLFPPPVGVPAFDTTSWTLEELRFRTDSKLNLTNRFDFQFPFDSGDSDEVLYVKNLVLEPDAVLNTAFQRMYYGTLTLIEDDGDQITWPSSTAFPEEFTNRAKVVNIPLLGFSLVNITMERDDEFHARIDRRLLEDPLGDPNEPFHPRGVIQRVDDPVDPAANGLMEMRTDDPNDQAPSATSVIAKGHFAKASEDRITIAFEYLFRDIPNVELIIYLSADPDVNVGVCPNIQAPVGCNVEVARLTPPPAGRPGALDSSEFGVFYGEYPRGNLNFLRGTYVALELVGTDTRILIDNWDPQISCTSSCADLDEGQDVNDRDFLLQLSEYGSGVDPFTPTGKGCLDSSTSGDFYVDLTDLLAWDTWLNGARLNACGPQASRAAWPTPTQPGPVTLPNGDSLLLAGKKDTAGVQDDFLFATNLAGTCIGPVQPPASVPDLVMGYRSNGRLVQDGEGNVYQIHSTQGLIRLDTAEVVIPPKSFPGFMDDGQNVDVQVGIGITDDFIDFVDFVGLPLSDAAFHPGDPNIVYVLPVMVQPTSGTCPYRAAAKLQLLPGGDYNLVRLYGQNPDTFDCDTVPNIERQRLREIEADASGNLYVLSSHALNHNDWLLLYDEALGTSSEIPVLLSDFQPALNSPVALTLSAVDPNTLYAASSINASETTTIYRLGISHAGTRAVGATLTGLLAIDNSAALDLSHDQGLGYRATITAIQENPASGDLYAVGFTMPKFDPDLSPTDPLFDPFQGQLLTTASLAIVPASTVWSTTNPPFEAVTSVPIDCHNLALPISAVFTSTCAPTIVASDPPRNAIDARQPYALTAISPALGWDSIELDLPSCAVTAGVNAVDFMISESGGTVPAPIVAIVTTIDADTVHLVFDQPIEPGVWTIVSNSAASTCLGFLPGDVDASRTSDDQDIVALFSTLDGTAPRPQHATDADRSGVTTTEDLVELLNLLNGAGAYDPWLNQALPQSPCP